MERIENGFVELVGVSAAAVHGGDRCAVVDEEKDIACVLEQWRIVFSRDGDGLRFKFVDFGRLVPVRPSSGVLVHLSCGLVEEQGAIAGDAGVRYEDQLIGDGRRRVRRPRIGNDGVAPLSPWSQDGRPNVGPRAGVAVASELR